MITKEEKEINLMSPLVWAYVGDAVYELYIRTHLINTTNQNAHNLHVESTKYVKASSQAQILQKIMPNLTEEEQDIVRRTRNVHNHHLPKNSNVSDYSYATALEGLIGYVYLTKQFHRLGEILNLALVENKNVK